MNDESRQGGPGRVATSPGRGRIALVGLRGTGKSTVGRLVAAHLGWAFADADDEVERTAGRTVAAIFAGEGEAGFRDREAAVLAELLDRPQIVVAAGGGAVLRPENRRLLKACGVVAWLTADPAALADRLAADPATADRRPALTGLGPAAELAALLDARAALYAEVATVTVPTAGRSPGAVAADIITAYAGHSPPA